MVTGARARETKKSYGDEDRDRVMKKSNKVWRNEEKER